MPLPIKASLFTGLVYTARIAPELWAAAPALDHTRLTRRWMENRRPPI
jgi:hypothetical protein